MAPALTAGDPGGGRRGEGQGNVADVSKWLRARTQQEGAEESVETEVTVMEPVFKN